MSSHPVRIVVADDLERSRLTVFFRVLLALPHLAWLSIWSTGAAVAVVVNWVATLVRGASPLVLHEFLVRYVRYSTHVGAFLFLAAGPFPGFTGDPGRYPVDVEIDAPQRQNRWTVAFRIVLALPALLVVGALVGGARSGGGWGVSLGVAGTVAFLAWFAALATGRMPPGFRDLLVYVLGYQAQVDAYLFVLVDRYPDSAPEHVPVAPPSPLPVTLALGDDGRRSRLTVFFRALLSLPHLVWLALWTIAALLAAIVNWAATLARGGSPPALHRFLAAFVRYQAHVTAYLYLVSNPFPGFAGAPGYPVDVAVEPPARQGRWSVGFRALLAIPALLVQSALGSALAAAAFLGWFAALVTGRMPPGLRDLGAYVVRYGAHVTAYGCVLTDRYPYSGPVLG